MNDEPIFDQFDDVARGYDSITFVRAPAKRVVEVANISSGEIILDVACGTGWVSLPAAQATGPNGQLFAIDISPQMIARAQAKATAAGIEHIKFSESDGGSPPFDEGQFNVIVCGLALFAFPDIGQTLRNWNHCLKPGGRVVFSTWGPGFLQQFAELLAVRFTEVTGKPATDSVPNRLNNKAECHDYLQSAGFDEIVIYAEDLGYFHPGLEDYWQELSSTLHGIKLKTLAQEQQDTIRELHLADVSRLMSAEGIRVDAPVIIASAHKPIG